MARKLAPQEVHVDIIQTTTPKLTNFNVRVSGPDGKVREADAFHADAEHAEILLLDWIDGATARYEGIPIIETRTSR